MGRSVSLEYYKHKTTNEHVNIHIYCIVVSLSLKGATVGE